MPQIRKEQLNSLSANWSTYTYTATAGDTFTDLPAGFEAATVTQVSAGDPSVPTRGIVTTASDNYVKVKLQSNGSSLSDSGSIFGRLTYSAGTYTVTYYKLSSGSEVSATLPGSGSYDLTIVFPEVMQFSEVPASALITLGENSGSGAGAIIIPDGGTISGNYNTTVYCQGSATISGALTVNGNLIVVNSLINDSSYPVDIKGNLIAPVINFNPDTTVQIQDNLTVGGDLIADIIYYAQTVGSNSNLIVKGNATIYSGIFANGYDDANGLDIEIFGDLKSGDASIEISGGNANATDFGGNGGQLLVYGDASVFALYAYGGDADDSILLTGLKTAGNGGYLEVRSNFNGRVVLDGGDAFEANAGDAGSCIIDGHAQLIYCDATGGLCNSSNENHRSGSGGYVDISGGLNSSGTIDLSGGNRIGTLTTNGAQMPPDGGNLSVIGDCNIEDVYVSGGSINTNNGHPSQAGSGGNVNITGSLFANGSIVSGGASANTGNAGDGGYIEISGDVNAVFSSIFSIGGNSFLANAGSGGSIDIYGSLLCSYISNYGGEVNGGFFGNGNGGSSGSVYVKGISIVSGVEGWGGSSNCGSGGSSGYFDFDSGLIASGDIDIYGGDCQSSDEFDIAGNGGFLTLSFILGFPDINIYGGNRTGTTSVPNLGNATAYGGSIYIDGNAEIDDIDGHGGSVNTASPNSAGGNGSNIFISGNLNVNSVNINGGDCIGSNGGNGGTIDVTGNLNYEVEIFSTGGDSQDGDYLGGYYFGGTGGSITVKGNLTSASSLFFSTNINLSGGDGTDSSAGSGGNLNVSGNANVQNVTLYGGDCDDTGLTGNFSAGNGGNVTINGCLTASQPFTGILLDGGDGSAASGGSGGDMTVGGNAVITYFESTGGNCTLSAYDNQNSASGGDLFIYGSLSGYSYINLSGGNRDGTLISAGVLTEPRGGDITIFGSTSADSIISNGGSMNTVSFAPSNAGNGGSITFYGPVSCTDITINGGSSTTSWAGNGGNIIITKCSVTCSDIQSNGGNSSNGDGGNGGNITGLGYIIADTVSLDGGDGNEGEGGNAGQITFTSGYLMVDSAININGGDCVSTNGNDNSGSGGSINVSSLTGQCDIYGNAGDRTGNTVALASPTAADGADIDVFDGPMNVRAIYLNGGSSAPTNLLSTHYPNANGGDGGSIRIHGNFNFLEIELSGGSSYGRDAGSAGYLEVDGFTSNNATPFTPITSIGGDSFAITTPAAPAGLVGSGGTFAFYGGTAISKLESKDGSSGSVTTSPMEIILGGHCSFGVLDVTNRANSKIYGDDAKPTTLKVLSMPTKTTLDVDSITASASVSSYLDDSIFSYSSSSWYRHTGVAI